MNMIVSALRFFFTYTIDRPELARNVLFFDRATPGSGIATKGLWVYDLRTNQRFTLRERPLKRADLDAFVKSYGSKSGRAKREEIERFHRFSYDYLVKPNT